MKRNTTPRHAGGFLAGQGFYIVLFLCVAAIGISGYYLLTGLLPDNTASQPEETAGSAQVEVTPQAPSVSSSDETLTQTTPKTDDSASDSDSQSQSGASETSAKSLVFTWPVNGTVLTDYSVEVFGYDETMGDWRTHNGLDISASLGDQVLAVSAGTVTAVVDDPLMGVKVTIDHGNGLSSVYANLAEEPTVSVGDTVSTGDVIGSVGSTAISESMMDSHLHLEMWKDGSPVNPADYLP